MQSTPKEDIYEEVFVENLFDKMSKTYGITNYISSFGFTERWRRQCIDEIDWNSNLKEGYDLMSGMGESWHFILKKAPVKIIGIDISEEMNKRANEKLAKHKNWNITIQKENILNPNTLKTASADFITSTFGLKTFSAEQQKILAKEIHRLLKKGGQFSMIEISEPNNKLLKLLYLFYLKLVIPIIGILFMDNSSGYKMLGRYCQNFKSCEQFKQYLEAEGLQVSLKEYFGGCATGVVGTKVK